MIYDPLRSESIRRDRRRFRGRVRGQGSPLWSGQGNVLREVQNSPVELGSCDPGLWGVICFPGERNRCGTADGGTAREGPD